MVVEIRDLFGLVLVGFAHVLLAIKLPPIGYAFLVLDTGRVRRSKVVKAQVVFRAVAVTDGWFCHERKEFEGLD